MKGLMEEQIDICKQYHYITRMHNLNIDVFALYHTIEKCYGSCKKYIPRNGDYEKCMQDRHTKAVQCMDDVISSMIIQKVESIRDYDDFLTFHKDVLSGE